MIARRSTRSSRAALQGRANAARRRFGAAYKALGLVAALIMRGCDEPRHLRGEIFNYRSCRRDMLPRTSTIAMFGTGDKNKGCVMFDRYVVDEIIPPYRPAAFAGREPCGLLHAVQRRMFRALPCRCRRRRVRPFAVVPEDPKLAGGLEFATYANSVAAEMEQLGYVRAASPEAADLSGPVRLPGG